MIKDGKNQEQVDAERAAKERAGRILEKVNERRRWAELTRTYERCVTIAKATWGTALGDASAQQQTLAEQMRDRRVGPGPWMTAGGQLIDGPDASIPVPLFTPRDRLQFLKEAAVALLIESGKRGLTVTPELKDAPKEPERQAESGIEAASGTSEEALESEAAEVTPS